MLYARFGHRLVMVTSLVPNIKLLFCHSQVISQVLLRMKTRYWHYKQSEVANRDRALVDTIQCLIRWLCVPFLYITDLIIP